VPATGVLWWIFTIVIIFWNIMFRYEPGFIEIARVSPRSVSCFSPWLSVLLVLSSTFFLSVTLVISIGVTNLFWKFAFIFKYFTDGIILDNIKSVFGKLSEGRRVY